MGRASGGVGGTSRKYHCAKHGTRSSYRGKFPGATPTMEPLDTLRRSQSHPSWLRDHPWVSVQLERVANGDTKSGPSLRRAKRGSIAGKHQGGDKDVTR